MRRLAHSLLTIGCSATALAQDARVLETVAPVVLMDGRAIVACGARASTVGSGGEISVEVRLMRMAGGADLVLSGAVGGSDAMVSADTASITSSELFAEGSTGPTRRTSANDPRVTVFIQELMVSGARVRFERAGTPPIEAIIRGPLPQSTRAAYLNCAGDLYRPGD